MANETPGTVRIRLLGPVELVADDVDLAGIKQPLLLSLLAVRPGEVVPTDSLVDVLWGEAAPTDPVRSLQVHISNLRRALAAAELDATIDHRQDGYVLRIDPGAIDLGRFEDLVERGIAVLDDDPEQARTVLGVRQPHRRRRTGAGTGRVQRPRAAAGAEAGVGSRQRPPVRPQHPTRLRRAIRPSTRSTRRS